MPCTSLLLAFLAFGIRAGAQPARLSLDECYRLARENYPAVRKLDLIAKSRQYTIENANKRYLPQVSFSGQASYQSQTISFSDVLGNVLPPNVALPSLSKDQYRVQGDIDQQIYDGGNTRYQKEAAKTNAALQQQNLEVSLYAMRDRINAIYFSILLTDAQLAQNEINKADLKSQLDKAQAALANGTTFRSSVDELRAEIINVDAAGVEYRANRAAFLKMLSLFIGNEISSSAELALPEPVSADTDNIGRPELKVFELQKAAYDVQQSQLQSAYLPKVSAFFQGAYGRPTLNIIENQFGWWYITGLRFNWSLGSLYTLRGQKSLIGLSRETAEADKETFLFNTQLDLSQETQQVTKYRELAEQDRQEIALRQSVKKSAAAQLENGVITTHEYLAQSDAVNLSQQRLLLHRIQLLQAEYNLRYKAGN